MKKFAFAPAAFWFALLPLCQPMASAQAPETAQIEKPTDKPTDKPVPWEKEIRAFEEQDKKTPPPEGGVLFVGSSSIRLWTTLAEDFAEIPTIRRGFGGSGIPDSTRFADRIVTPYKPRLVVMYAGGNDLARGKTPAQVLEFFQEFVAQVHKTLPDTTIAYISLSPTIARWKKDHDVRETNRLISEWMEEWMEDKPRLKFLEAYSALLGPDGLPQKNLLREDGLHLNADGYKAWTSILKPQILKLYEDAEKPA